MVSALTVAVIATLAGVSQPPKVPGRIQPGKVAAAPANPFQPKKGSTGKCSVPLMNVPAGAREPRGWPMPVVRPRDTRPMPSVQPPAPPCASRPSR